MTWHIKVIRNTIMVVFILGFSELVDLLNVFHRLKGVKV